MELRFRNTILFLISFAVIFLMLLLLFNDNKPKINEENLKTFRDDYAKYKVDTLVQLKDNSEWYVLKNSSNTERDVYLLSKEKNNIEVVSDIKHFVKDEYLETLCNSLHISRSEVSEIRLLNSSDICDLDNKDCTSFSFNFDTSKYKMLENATIVDYMENNKYLSLCSEGFCNNDNNDIRVVIKIPKFFIKEG